MKWCQTSSSNILGTSTYYVGEEDAGRVYRVAQALFLGTFSSVHYKSSLLLNFFDQTEMIATVRNREVICFEK